MRGGGIFIGRGGKAGLALVLLGGAMLSACDPTAELRKPELGTCQRFLRSRLRVPSSFHRNWYNVADLPVGRDLLAKATGDAARAKTAPNPAIRRVSIQYGGNDGYGAEVTGFGTCYFAMTDAAAGTYAADIETLVDKAVIENEQNTLSYSMGDRNAHLAECCTVPAFDPKALDGIKAQRRGTIRPGGRKS